MLSDRISEAVKDLNEALEEYSQPPFEYGPRLLATLEFLIDELDGIGRSWTHRLPSCQSQARRERIKARDHDSKI